MFIEVNDFSPGNVCKLIWFCDEYFLHHLCGYLVVYLTDSRFRFFRIILVMFGQRLLYVIAKGMCMLIDVSFYVIRVRISLWQLAICEAFWQFANAVLRFF